MSKAHSKCDLVNYEDMRLHVEGNATSSMAHWISLDNIWYMGGTVATGMLMSRSLKTKPTC